MMEMDVRSTKDGALISLHDADVKRTTNGKGLARDLTLAELRKLDAGSWFDPKYKDERIPTLREILELGKGKIDILIDLQQTGEVYTDEYAARITDEVRKFGEPKRVWFGVRSVENAIRFRKLLPEAKQIALIPTADSIDAFADAKVDMIRLWPKWLDDKMLIRASGSTSCSCTLTARSAPRKRRCGCSAHEPDSLASDDPGRLVLTLKKIAGK